MAGGEFGKEVVCNTCLYEEGNLILAERISEGLENDHYCCQNGHRFGIHWDSESFPHSPLWPPSEEEKEIAKVVKVLFDKGLRKMEILKELSDRKLI